MSKRSPKSASKPARAARDKPDLRIYAFLFAILACAGIGWFGYNRFLGGRLALPNLPAHSDPVVAAQIREAADAVRQSPRTGPAWGKLGMILHAYLFEDEASICFANAQRFDPAEPRWPYFEGVILLASDPPAALGYLAHAVELCPSAPDTPRLQYAQALAEQGRWDAAEAQFQQLLRLNPAHAPALLGLARIADARQQLDNAAEYLGRCVENPFTRRDGLLLLAKVEAKRGSAAAAEKAATAARALPPDQSWPEPYTEEIVRLQIGLSQLVSQAERLLKEGRNDDAETIIARLIKQHATAPETWLLSGRLRLQRKDCASAEQALRRHLQLAPDSVNGHAQLGMALLCLERYAEAMPVLERAVKLKPDFAEAHFNLGFARARAGHGNEAMIAFRDAIRCSPNFIEPYITLADLLSQKGEMEEASALLHRARSLNPSDPRPTAVLDRIKARASRPQ